MRVYKVGIAEIAIAPLASRLKSALDVGPTVWFVSGGSNIKLTVEVMQRIDIDHSANLTVALADERYGVFGHADSNWAQLKEAGFDPKNARVIETIKPELFSLEDTVRNYEAEISQAMDNADTLIGQFGMGADGHIAGILPNSPAALEQETLVTGYEGQPFNRITLTFSAIRRLNSAFLIVMGQEKREQLDRLINQNLELQQQPAQIIKQVRESYLYNDQLEGSQQ